MPALLRSAEQLTLVWDKQHGYFGGIPRLQPAWWLPFDTGGHFDRQRVGEWAASRCGAAALLY